MESVEALGLLKEKDDNYVIKQNSSSRNDHNDSATENNGENETQNLLGTLHRLSRETSSYGSCSECVFDNNGLTSTDASSQHKNQTSICTNVENFLRQGSLILSGKISSTGLDIPRRFSEELPWKRPKPKQLLRTISDNAQAIYYRNNVVQTMRSKSFPSLLGCHWRSRFIESLSNIFCRRKYDLDTPTMPRISRSLSQVRLFMDHYRASSGD